MLIRFLPLGRESYCIPPCVHMSISQISTIYILWPGGYEVPKSKVRKKPTSHHNNSDDGHHKAFGLSFYFETVQPNFISLIHFLFGYKQCVFGLGLFIYIYVNTHNKQINLQHLVICTYVHLVK